MLKQGLQQKQVQKLSPLQIQTIKLLELTKLELEQRIEKEMEENPILDEVEDETDPEEGSKNVSLSDYNSSDDSIPSYKLRVNNQGKDLKPQYETFRVKESFHQSLISQLGYCNLDERSYQLALFIIGMIGDDGYLRRDLEHLAYDVEFNIGIKTDEEELERILGIIQEFEPVGVGARDIQECLLLQIKAKKPSPEQQLAEKILEDYFDEFTKKHYSKIMSRLDITEEELKGAIGEIVKLNPRPGGQIDDSYTEQAQQVVPDFLLDLVDGELVMSMPRFSVPELKVNKRYADELLNAANSSKDGKEAAAFVKQKLDSAKWFIEAIKQRQHTLESTMNAILEFQHDFFIDGDETKLKPMVLKNIAEKTGLDISTISRVVSSKYIQTHFGVYPLKYFFSEGLVNNEGEEVSTREIKKILTKEIEEEDKRKPLTDEELVAVLNEKGYQVARRTVAKYREQLNIPIARLRKEL
jgi:RNA polymerase sigma-54 factor